MPPEKERALKAKGKRLCSYTQIPELDLFMSVNALMRGWTNYFRYANNATNRFFYLTGVVYWLVAPSLVRKHRCSMKRAMRTAYGRDPVRGKRALYTSKGGNRVSLWNKPPPRRSIRSGVVDAKDVQPLPLTGGASGHSYAQRVAVKQHAAHRCQHCDAANPQLIVHHPNRLGKRKQRKQGPAPVIASGEEQRVKLLCLACHKQHHPGGWST